jgi:hypothetical protein
MLLLLLSLLAVPAIILLPLLSKLMFSRLHMKMKKMRRLNLLMPRLLLPRPPPQAR